MPGSKHGEINHCLIRRGSGVAVLLPPKYTILCCFCHVLCACHLAQCVAATFGPEPQCADYASKDTHVDATSIALYDPTGSNLVGCIDKAKRECLETQYPI